MTIVLALFLALGIVLVFAIGVVVGSRAMTKQALAQAGFTMESAALYKRAARLLSRMATVTELDGDLAADLLSPRSKELLTEWLADYRKQIERV